MDICLLKSVSYVLVLANTQTCSEWDVRCWQTDMVPFCLCDLPPPPNSEDCKQTEHTQRWKHRQDRWTYKSCIGIYTLWTNAHRNTHTDLSISPNGASTVSEQLRHVVVTGELPQTGFQVQVPVETQCAVPTQGATELIRRCVSHAVRAAYGFGDKAMACGDLPVIEQVGAAVVSNPRPVWTESQLKVRERPGGDHRKHAYK